MRMSMRTIPRAAGMVLSCGVILAVASGCQGKVKIAWKAPEAIRVEKTTPLVVGDLAKLNREGGIWCRQPSDQIIGNHTWTIFGFPGLRMRTAADTPLKDSFDSAIRDALESTGYELVEAGNAPDGAPVLRGEVNNCWLWSYTYFWPIMLEGGRNRVTLFLDDANGRNVWSHRFSRGAPGLGLFGAYGYNGMMRRSISKILRDIQRETDDEAFRKHLTR